MGPKEALHLVSTILTQPSDCLTIEGVAEVLTRQGKDSVTGPEVWKKALHFLDRYRLSTSIEIFEFDAFSESPVDDGNEPARPGLVVPNNKARD
jgi:hypothetical protein